MDIIITAKRNAYLKKSWFNDILSLSWLSGILITIITTQVKKHLLKS